MKYNCLRIHPYAKMFVVGLLLYLGETVFFKCSEEGTFTVKVKKLSGIVIEVHNCKGTDKLSVFMKKFEEAYDKNSTNEKIKGIPYNLTYNGSPIVMASMPVKDETLAALGIDKNSMLCFVVPLKNHGKYNKSVNFKICKGNNDKDFLKSTEKKEGSSTSTCPLRRCCRICGC